MKKQYITPQTLNLKVNLQSMIALSKPIDFSDTDDSGSITPQDGDATGPAMGRRRRRNDWEDDWDEEEDW